MNWIAIVATNRNLIVRDCVFTFNNIDISDYDVIIGYRSDNSNLVALKQCLEGVITRTTLLNILSSDERNVEVCLKSSEAKSRLEFKRVISKDSAKPIDDIETRRMLKVSDSYLFELTKLLSEYFACFIECGKSYDDAYNTLIDSGIFKRLNGRFIAGVSGSELYTICTGVKYKNCKIDHYDFWLSNLISRYVISNGYDLSIFRNKDISMEQLLANQVKYKNCKIDHYDFWLSNLISRYVISNGYDLSIFRNKDISMEQLLANQGASLDMIIN